MDNHSDKTPLKKIKYVQGLLYVKIKRIYWQYRDSPLVNVLVDSLES